MKQTRYDEIEEGFRVLGLASETERDRLLRLSQISASEDEPKYRISAAGNTKVVQEESENAELE